MDISLHRTSPSEFIIPFDQYMDAIKSNYSIGMRFRMRFEGEEAPEQRYMKRKKNCYVHLWLYKVLQIMGI
jgi:Auxin response factor